MIGMVESEATRNGVTSIERRYYLCSAAFAVLTVAAIVPTDDGATRVKLVEQILALLDKERSR